MELPDGNTCHPQAIALNTGRNCLEYILRCRCFSKVYIPYYTCEVVMEPLHKLGIPYEHYHIDKRLEIADNISLRGNEALLYTNYFGLKQAYVEKLANYYGGHLIVDNTQAFYAKPIPHIDTFYSCRKFFGVPDGAYLYTDAYADFEIEQDVSYERMSYLLKRLDLGAEAGYADFHKQSQRLVGQPIKRMSNLTAQIMKGINYKAVAQRRRVNFNYLHLHLAETNHLSFELDEKSVPMAYPYLNDDQTLKLRLITEKIFMATYWHNVMEWCKPEDWEYVLSERTVFLPVDQRYGLEDMKRIVDTI